MKFTRLFIYLFFTASLINCKSNISQHFQDNSTQTKQTEVQTSDKIKANFYLSLNKEKSTVSAYFKNSNDEIVEVSNVQFNGKELEKRNKEFCISTENCYEIKFNGIEKSYIFSFIDEKGKENKINFQIDPLYFNDNSIIFSRSQNQPIPISRKLTNEESEIWLGVFDENPQGGSKEIAQLTKNRDAIILPSEKSKEMWVGKGKIQMYPTNKEQKIETETVIANLEYKAELPIEIIR